MQLLNFIPLILFGFATASPFEPNSTNADTSTSPKVKNCGSIWHYNHYHQLYSGNCDESFPGTYNVNNCVCLFTNDHICQDLSKIVTKAGGAFPKTGETKAQFYICAG